MKRKRIISAITASAAAITYASALFSAMPQAIAADNDICINEVCSRNKSCLTDGYGKNADWVELYNNGSSAVDISGFGLSDNAEIPLKWTFPTGTVIGAGSHLIVFASGRESMGSELHANFSISKNGETIVLSNAGGNIIQQVEVPTLGEDMTYGRTPDGSETLEIMDATPGTANAQVISAPKFSAESGFYGTDLALSLSSESGEIYYTVDGSDPKSSNTAQRYSGAITVRDRSDQPNIYSAKGESESADSICRGISYRPPSFNVEKATVVRAVVRSADGKYSSTVSNTYFITNGELSKYKNMTVVSLVADPDDLFDPEKGIYVTGNKYLDWRNSGSYDPSKSVWDTDNVCNYFSKGKDWERPADITVFENGSKIIDQKMGIRIKGASTRNHAQKSFNLYARSEYGASKIEYPLFADNYDLDGKLIEKYDSVSLRSLIDETRVNDSLAQGYLEDRHDLATQKMRHCVLFLNGEYWGMYEITERLSDYYIESNYNIPKQYIAMIKSSELEEGPQSECDAFLDFAEKYAYADMTNEANYKAVCDYIDIDSMIDHYAAGLYLGTYDWPNRNYGVWRNMGSEIEGNPYSDGKWRFITYDLDYTMGATYEDFGGVEGYAYNSFKHMEGQKKYAPTNLFLNLLNNKEFRNKFAGVFCDYSNFIFTPEKTNSRIDSYTRDLTDMVAQSVLRWWGFYGGDPACTLAWNKQNFSGKCMNGLRTFFDRRSDFALVHMKEYLRLDGDLHAITLKSGGHGSIRINSIVPDLSNGSWTGRYFSDCPVTITAIPDEGYGFDGWSGDETGSSMTITVPLSNAMTIQANFSEQKTVRGDVNADGQFSAADLVAMSKFLLGSGSLADQKAGDLCEDGVIDTYDLIMMRKEVTGR